MKTTESTFFYDCVIENTAFFGVVLKIRSKIPLLVRVTGSISCRMKDEGLMTYMVEYREIWWGGSMENSVLEIIHRAPPILLLKSQIIEN